MSDNNEYVTYKGIPACEVQKQLDIQKWILDPTSIPHENKEQKLIARSAAASTEAKQQQQRSTVVEKQLALQRMILGD